MTSRFYLITLIAAVVSQHQKTIFQCDRLFDVSIPEGSFSFPFAPPSVLNGTGNGSYNLQCVYTFVAGPRQRVKLEFEHFLLSGSSESCDIEYIDIYSEIESIDADLLSSSLGGRFCGSVAPHVRISLHRILILVLHSRAQQNHENYGFKAKYAFINEEKYIPGNKVPYTKCSYVIDSDSHPSGSIYSPTYPGSYPHNMHCSYLLQGYKDQRVRIFLQDFDIFFGGEHCPYDSLTIFDGETSNSPIIRKLCGLQQRMEVYSVGESLLIHFNTSQPGNSDPRGFIIDYEFSDRFVKIESLIGGEKGVTHLRGTECDVRVESNRETKHYVNSPNYPNAYPPNTTCTYIIDGLQGDQNLEMVILTFMHVAVLSYDATPITGPPSIDDIACPSAWVGVATSEGNMKSVMSSTDDSNFDFTICERIPVGSPLLGPYSSAGPRMVVQFGTTDIRDDGVAPLGFRAEIEFKTDFGVTGEALGTSNECAFRFTSSGFFNSPRYPANYPLDTNCTYYIVGRPGTEILIHFEQFALFEDALNKCADWVEIYDVIYVEGQERLTLQQRYCSDTFPGPSVSSFGSHEMRVIFSSNSAGTANGFKALFEIRPARREDVPSFFDSNSRRCGSRIDATDAHPTGFIYSPNFPVKYNKDVHCDWLVNVRPGNQILLKIITLDVEGEMTAEMAMCQKAVIRIDGADREEYCGTNNDVFKAFLTSNNSVRISFLTAPDKVNGLKGFNLSWTEVRQLESGEESKCSTEDHYLCTYSKLCIDSKLRCNGLDNCGTTLSDDSDEQHCSLKEKKADKTVMAAAVLCGVIFLFICVFFFYLFKKKLERKKKKKRKDGSRHRQRQPYRQQRPVLKAHCDTELSSPATSRFVHHDATGILPPVQLRPTSPPGQQTFYG